MTVYLTIIKILFPGSDHTLIEGIKQSIKNILIAYAFKNTLAQLRSVLILINANIIFKIGKYSTVTSQKTLACN